MLRNLIVHGLLALNLCSAIGLIKAQYSDFKVGRKQTDYRIGELSDSEFAVYSRLSDKSHLREAVRNILKPRVVGTPGHQQVREYIVQSLRDLNWHVDINSFHDTTPIFGKLHFHNIIAKHNPNAERYLTLACHYDSKYFKDFEFLGATDSAVPCAMMLNMAHVLQQHLEAYKDSKLSLMLIFFDGEEAFEEWGPNDSIYGARHLAKKWEQSGFLDRLDLLVLLDLIGGPDPNFYSFFSKTEGLYSRFLDIEERLSNAEVLERYANSGVTKSYPNRYFQPNALRNSHVEDDHVPFLKLNVPVLHLITMPFPSFWHTKDDSEQVIDYATTENVALILRIFVMEYLHGAKAVAA